MQADSAVSDSHEIWPGGSWCWKERDGWYWSDEVQYPHGPLPTKEEAHAAAKLNAETLSKELC